MNAPRKLLCELIALPSVNPAFLVKDDPGGGERQVAEFLAATAAKAGLDIEFQPVLPGRANLLARCLPRGRVRHRVLLAPIWTRSEAGAPAISRRAWLAGDCMAAGPATPKAASPRCCRP